MNREGIKTEICTEPECQIKLTVRNRSGFCEKHRWLKKNRRKLLNVAKQSMDAVSKSEREDREAVRARQEEAMKNFRIELSLKKVRPVIQGQLRGNVQNRHNAFRRIPVSYNYEAMTR